MLAPINTTLNSIYIFQIPISKPNTAMASTSLLSSSSSIVSFNPFSGINRHRKRAARSATRVFASSRKEADHEQYRQNFYRSRLVDENTIVLRKRVHEMKMVERNYEPPSDWLDWEKRYYTTYDSFICQLMGLLQSQLMNTRPSFALATMALIIFSLPTSTLLLFFHLLDLTKGVLTLN